MATKPTPVRHNAVINWTAPHDDPEVPSEFGYCVDHYVVDPKYISSVYEPGKPPPPTAAYWKASDTTQGRLLVVPELRGAILHPITIYENASTRMKPTNRALQTGAYPYPCWANTGFTAGGVRSGDAADEPWKYEKHQNTGTQVAYYCPDDLDATETAGKNWIYVEDDAGYSPVSRSFSFAYALSPPQARDEDGVTAAFGFELYLGCQQDECTTSDATVPTGAQPQYSIRFTSESPLDATSWWWTVYKYTYASGVPTKTGVAYERNPGGFTSVRNLAELVLDNVSVIDLPDGLMVVTSQLGGNPWLYTPEDWGGIRRGYTMLRVFGTQGWFVWGRILFPATTTIVGPVTTGSSQFTYSGDVSVSIRSSRRYVSAPSTDHTWTGSFVEDSPSARTGHIQFSIANGTPSETVNGRTGCRTTCVVYRATEVHDPTYPTTSDFPKTPIQSLGVVKGFDIQYAETGRGTTATVRVTDDVEETTAEPEVPVGGEDTWQPSTTPPERTQDALYDLLKGMGRVSIDIMPVYDGDVNTDFTDNEVEQGIAVPERHEDGADDDDTYYRVFTGYLIGVEREETPQGIPELVLRLADRAALWEGDKSSTLFLPQPCGWEFKTYCRLVLKQFGMVDNEYTGLILFPDDLPDDDLYIPYLDNGAEIHFDPQTSLPLVLDRVCDLCGMIWYISEEGDVVFDFDMLGYGQTEAPDFILTEDNVSDVDAVYLPETSRVDYTQAITHALVVGKTKAGYENPALAIDTRGTGNTDSRMYVGRPLWHFSFKPDDPAPNTTAAKVIREAQAKTWDIKWESIFRDIKIGQVVEFRIPSLGMPNGARFRITGKSVDLEAASSNGDGLCKCTFQAVYLITNQSVT